MYRDTAVACPACTGTLTRDSEDQALRCRRCSGCFMSSKEFDGLVARSAVGPGAFTLSDSPEHVRPCPFCQSSMTVVDLAGVRLDRCEEHGVWFDYQELRSVLVQVGKH